MIDTKIRRATRGQAEELTRIAFGAKRHRGYLEPSIERWASALTISPRFADTNEVWVAMLEEQGEGLLRAFRRASGGNCRAITGVAGTDRARGGQPVVSPRRIALPVMEIAL